MKEKDPFGEVGEEILEQTPPDAEFGDSASVQAAEAPAIVSPPPPTLPPPPTADPNVYPLSERKKMEEQDTAAIIFSIMDGVDKRIVQFFSRDFLKKQILINNGLNGSKLAIYFDESQERVATRIRMLADIGAIFFDENGTPIANEKIVQFISAVAPTY